MSDLNELKSLIERLPKTDAYGAARQVGGLLLQILEQSEGHRRPRWMPYVDPSAQAAEDPDLGDDWQHVGDVAKRVVTSLRRIDG